MCTYSDVGPVELWFSLGESLFARIVVFKVAPQPTMPSVTTTTTITRTRTVATTPATATAATATAKEVQDIKALCCCLSISQLDNYSTWLRVGIILKKLGAP